jgi:N-acetylmuramoyl-L-alanine amidase
MTLRMRTVLTFLLVCLLVHPAAFAEGKGMTVKGVRYFSYAAFTRIVFELETAAPYVLTKAADGRSLRLSAYDGRIALKSPLPAIRDSVVSGIESTGDADAMSIIVRLEAGAGEVKDFSLRGPDRIVLDIARGASAATAPQAGKIAVVVLDAGHGGADAGIVTARGLEKNITLGVAQAIKKILEKDPRFKPLLTRTKDQALSLNDRALAANAADAAVFVSIHAAPGMNDRVFIPDLDDDTGIQAARPASRDFLSFEAGSDRQGMLWGTQQTAHARDSGELGRLIARKLEARDSAEPVQAPLAELKAVDAAAVMLEVGTASDWEKAAAAVAMGIEQYAGKNR